MAPFLCTGNLLYQDWMDYVGFFFLMSHMNLELFLFWLSVCFYNPDTHRHTLTEEAGSSLPSVFLNLQGKTSFRENPICAPPKGAMSSSVLYFSVQGFMDFMRLPPCWTECFFCAFQKLPLFNQRKPPPFNQIRIGQHHINKINSLNHFSMLLHLVPLVRKVV